MKDLLPFPSDCLKLDLLNQKICYKCFSKKNIYNKVIVENHLLGICDGCNDILIAQKKHLITEQEAEEDIDYQRMKSETPFKNLFDI